jgi:tetratricopeptide repeat protein
MRHITISGLIVVLALVSLRAGDEKKASVLMQAALAKETVQGDLKGAIDLYESAVTEAGSNRALAARALVGLGDAQLKLGNAQARKIYEQIVREYADQKDAVVIARAAVGRAPRLRRRSRWHHPQRPEPPSDARHVDQGEPESLRCVPRCDVPRWHIVHVALT